VTARSLITGRVLFTLICVVAFRAGTFLPLPGLDVGAALDLSFNGDWEFLGVYNLFVGGALARCSLLTLGEFPVSAAQGTVSLLGLIFKSVGELKREGESGKRKLERMGRYLTLLFALLFGVFVSFFIFRHVKTRAADIGVVPFCTVGALSLATGTMLLGWLADQISDRGIPPGPQVLGLVGMLAELPRVLRDLASHAQWTHLALAAVLGVAAVYLLVTAHLGRRRVPLQYAKRPVGRHFASSPSMPFRFVIVGIEPLKYTTAFILLPSLVLFFVHDRWGLRSRLQDIAAGRSWASPLVIAVSAVFWTAFLTPIRLSFAEMADRLKQTGGFIPGVRPGRTTEVYLGGICMRLAAGAGVFLAVFVLAVSQLGRLIGLTLGGIVLWNWVDAWLAIMDNVEAMLVTSQYEDLDPGSPRLGNRRT
jgi:preprotein translocase subunit SecY